MYHNSTKDSNYVINNQGEKPGPKWVPCGTPLKFYIGLKSVIDFDIWTDIFLLST